MTLTGNVVTWTPAAAAVDSVVAVFSHPSYLKGTDTLKWAVSAVASSNFVFWYNATANGYNLQQSNPGPGIPAGATVFQGVIATWNTRLSAAENTPDFAIGNGPGTALSGRSSMFYSADLCDKQGTAIKALVRGEFRDGWSGNAFCNEGQIIAKIGVIDMTVYRDLPVPNGYGGTIACDALYLGGCPACQNGWSYNMKFYYHPGTKVTIPGLMAEEIVTLQAPPGRSADQEPSVLDGKFYDIDVTTQVQWILDRKGKDYVETAKAGDYAIVFLVPNDATAGGTGKVNLYATECNLPYAPSNDAPWTTDGNTMHLYVEGDITPADIAVEKDASALLDIPAMSVCPTPSSGGPRIIVRGAKGKVAVSLYNVSGKKIRTLDFGGGREAILVKSLPNGIYFARLTVDGLIRQTTRFLVVK